MTRDQLEKIEAALADVPEKFITGRMYDKKTGCYCVLGWLGKKAGVPVENSLDCAEWAAAKVDEPEASVDFYVVIAHQYGLRGDIYTINDNHPSKYIDSKYTQYVNARAVADAVLDEARRELESSNA